MFTGIITEVGKIRKILGKKNGKTFQIKANKILKNKKIGDSIAVNGICLTITKLGKNNFEFDAVKETLKITNLKNSKNGDEANLESALILGETIDGHLIQGHIDGTGIVESMNNGVLTIKFPENISQYLAFKGAICINGVSLTISDLQEQTFSVALIPHTLKTTNLKNLKKGDEVNLEIDLFSRYLERILDRKTNEAKYEFLKERNLI